MRVKGFETITHQVDLCVVGGGMAGLIAAVSAARHGAKVLLMQDRPVLGGNASSEVRMWICGAHGMHAKETGVLEEIMLANYYRNRNRKYPVWDSVLYEKAQYQEGLTLLLNCACHEVRTDSPSEDVSGEHITSVKGWQASTQTFHEVFAKYYADCSGDSVLRISGAEFRWGRESRYEFNESHAPEEADSRTMGNTLLIETREVGYHEPFIPPTWAYNFKDSDISLQERHLTPTGENFWWLELGGMGNTIKEAEEIRSELLRVAFGVWDLIKNHPDGRARDWELDWMSALPGKRENVRYVGDHILTQGDILAGGKFDDTIAYGGWPMDDHNPGGLWYRGPATIFHNTPSPYGIPYRSLYSANIDNLFFAGRNISTTHMALSSTRVMGTCSVLGQAVGTAAALAVKYACTPREVGRSHLRELQSSLMDDDAYLPNFRRPISEISRSARLEADSGTPERLRSGIDRILADEDNGWWAAPNECATFTFDSPVQLSRARLTFDSNLSDTKRMPCWYPKEGTTVSMPKMLPKAFAIEIQDASGNWQRVHEVDNNFNRLVKLPLHGEAKAVRFIPLAAWGGEQVHIMAYEVA